MASGMNTDIPPEIIKAMPGAVGSVVALRWIAGTPLQRITAVVGGFAGSHYCTPFFVAWTGGDRDVINFTIGLFGMAIASKIYEAIDSIMPSDIVKRALKRIGL